MPLKIINKTYCFIYLTTIFAFVKTLDKYILKSFLKPFFATFLIILFVLVMQVLWLAFDSFAGKGISIGIILKFLWYTTLLVTPQALPIGVLLSSIMTLGTLSENYEFAAAKSAGISLPRMVRSLVFLTLFLSALNFVFLNNVYPYAMLKQLNMRVNIKKKQPSIALVAGSFNTELPNFQIKFKKKYGEKDNLLEEVMIYDLSAKKGNNKIITAKKGKIISEDGSRYMTLILENGYYFEHHIRNGSPLKERQKMPASYANFDQYTINIDISSLSGDNLEEERYKTQYNMLSLSQLKDTIPTLKKNYDAFINSRAKNLFSGIKVEDLHTYPDSLINKKLSKNTLDNFNLIEKENILNTASSKIDRSINNNNSNKETLKRKRKYLNLYDIEFYNRVAFSLSCLLLFFIGAPLGSIIRKGGMGLPMILAIAIYVLYFFTNTFGRNLAEESSITALTGSWLSILLMLPLAIILTIRATKDKGLFDFKSFISPVSNLFKNLFSKKEKTT
nr:LptF/LptG family permease [Tenacibaculum finnmarkense]